MVVVVTYVATIRGGGGVHGKQGLVGRSERSARYEPLHVLFEIATRDEDPPSASRTPQADVGAEPDDAPGVAAAGMRLSQDDDVIEIERNRSFDRGRRHRREV